MASELASYEAELKDYKQQLDTVVTSLRVDPDNEELQLLKDELQEVISLTETAVAELRPAPTEPPAESSGKPKWQKENQNRNAGTTPLSAVEDTQAAAAPAASYKVNDMVMAKWLSGDKAFYPARITSITGSSAAPVYIVTFKSYGNTETVRGADIKPVSTGAQKRKADGAPVSQTGGSSSNAAAPASPSTAAAPESNPGIISAAANINQDLADQAKRAGTDAAAGGGGARPAKVPRKVKANKELEAGKNKWQEFAAKGKFGKGGGGAKQKDSMFRTGEGVNARVGFTGSGQAMRKDQARTRHTYQVDEEDGGY